MHGSLAAAMHTSLRTLTCSSGPDQARVLPQGLVEHGLSSVMSGMDNVRNMTGSPIAGIDPHEFLDVRPLNYGAPPPAPHAALLRLCSLPQGSFLAGAALA